MEGSSCANTIQYNTIQYNTIQYTGKLLKASIFSIKKSIESSGSHNFRSIAVIALKFGMPLGTHQMMHLHVLGMGCYCTYARAVPASMPQKRLDRSRSKLMSLVTGQKGGFHKSVRVAICTCVRAEPASISQKRLDRSLSKLVCH